MSSSTCQNICHKIYPDLYRTRFRTILVDNTRFNLFDLGYRYCQICDYFTAHFLQKHECNPVNVRSGRAKVSYGKNTHCECCNTKFRIKNSVSTKRSLKHSAKVLRRKGIDPEEYQVVTRDEKCYYNNLVN